MRTRFPFRQATGLYVHSSPPTGVPVHDSVVRQWLRGGEISRLKELVLEGEGASLIGEYSPDVAARNFLRALPRILNRIEEAHEAAASGDVDRLAQAIKRERSVRVELSKDHSGLSLLHKAVIHGHRDLQIWLVENYPDLVHLLDREKRSPLHYAGSSPDGESVWKLLTTFGADSNLIDAGGYTPAYYMLHPRKARPPQPKGGAVKAEKGLVVKPANIRIWIHDRDLGRLQKVVWEGYGQRLLKETSTQPKVRRFLQAVPYILGSIRDLHKAAIENDIETLKSRSEDPIPADILLSKDVNGLNPLHKAAGMGRKEAVEEILKRAPEAANAQDSFGRTPLHYAAGLRDPEMYQTLVEAGATDHLPDKKGNTPSHYRSKPLELEGTKLLSVIPDAPRTAHIFPPSWDWKLLHSAETRLKSQMSTETITLDSTAEDITDNVNETEEISRDEVVEESRPEVSEDEGMGSENAQSVEDSASPQNGENIDMEDDPGDKFGQTITLSNPVFLSTIGVGPDEEELKQSEQGDEPETSKNEQSDEISQIQDDGQPEDNSSDEGKQPDVLNVDVEPIVDNQNNDDNDVHNNEETENLTENEVNSNSNEQTSGDAIQNVETNPNSDGQTNDDVLQDDAITDKPLNKIDSAHINRENSSRSSQTQSGRKSLKARVQKLMWLGRSQSSLQGRDDDFSQEEENLPSSKPSSALAKETEDSEKKNTEEEVRINSEQNLENKEEQTDYDAPESHKSGEQEELIPSQETEIENSNPEENAEPETEEKEFSNDSLNGKEEESEESEERAEIVANDKVEEVTEQENNMESSEITNKSTISGTRRTEAERVVAAGDMEAMAEMVLAGEGESLLDLTSDNPDVQLFINNVPQYMAKIERVHKSSREGDLRGVRTSLDRRKYAVAKDNSTSLKPTPLHVAVLFGRTSVLRYLAGRFPETMHAQDSGGRTPLHYAATLPDNGHFYSLLITLGADKAIVDKSGKTADYYLKNNEDLTREMLLAEYQDRPVPIDTSGLNFNRYSDKVEDDTISARHDVDEEALLEQMERCFKLLAMRAPGSILGRILTRDLFEELHLYYTKMDNTLLDIIRPMGKDLALGKNRILTDPNFSGIMIPDQQSFVLFGKLLEPLIKEVNGVAEFKNEQISDYFGAEDENFFTLDLDPGGVIVKSCVIEVVRNLAPVPFVKNLKLSELEKVEVALSTVLTGYYRKNKDAAFIDDAGENHGSYYSLGEILENKEVFQDLKEEGLVIGSVEDGDWPYGRGVFISPYGDVTAWINIREHLQLLSVTPAEKRGLIGPAYKTAFEMVQSLEEKVECLRDPRLGRLATDPGFVGNCLRIHVVVSLPHIGEDLPSLRKLCSSRNLLVEENSRPGIFKLRNRSCQNMREIDLLKSYVSGIKDIIEMEKASMRVTVAQIPNLIKNFLRKRSSKENLK